MRRVWVCALALALVTGVATARDRSDHHAGERCTTCHGELQVAGTVYDDVTGTRTQPDAPLVLVGSDGAEIVLEASDRHGNLSARLAPEGRYLVRLGTRTSRTWHEVPGQANCNVCHRAHPPEAGGLVMPPAHTGVPPDNHCAHCHHFPADKSLARLRPAGVLTSGDGRPDLPESYVEIRNRVYPFDPGEHDIRTVRPDIFSPGYFSVFDAILAVAREHGIRVEYEFDESCKAHFITQVGHTTGSPWYHFSYDAGDDADREIEYRRAYRWDELLWKPGTRIRLVWGEDLKAIKREYREEIERENLWGHVIPSVEIDINPSAYRGNPPESGRITVSRTFEDVEVRPHNLRSAGYPSPYSKPFQPGVVTALDVLLSLEDRGDLDLVGTVHYSRFDNHLIDSYFVVAMGFPNVGIANASGRQGFVYVVNNGSFQNLPNGADRKFHIPSDICVVHAPDFALWYWLELGDPYYEERTTDHLADGSDPSVTEDYRALRRGFNLQAPRTVEAGKTVQLAFNIFRPGPVELTVYDGGGRRLDTLYRDHVEDLGIHRMNWRAPADAGDDYYYLLMEYGGHLQIRTINVRPN